MFDLDVVSNSSDLERRYRGVRLQVDYRPRRDIALGLNYALSKTFGNYNGETFPSGGEANAGTQFYPEYSQLIPS